MHASPVYHSRIHESPVYRSLPGTSAGGEVSTGAVKFDGVNDYIVTASSPLSPGAGDFSACAWVKFTGVATQQVILSQLDGTGTGRTWIELTAGAKLQSAIGNSNLTGATSLVAGNWYHVAVTVSGTTETLYLNGVSDATGTRTPEAASGVARIGTSKSGANYLAGCIDDVRIYNVAISAAQIAAMYANTTPAPTAGLVGHWKLDDGSGTTAVDSSGNGNNGTLTNGPTWEVQVPPRLSRNRLTEDWSVSFDGVNDRVVIPLTSLSSMSIWSVTWWQKQNLVATYPVAVSFGSFYFHTPYNTNQTYYSARPTNRPTLDGINGVWTHITIVETGSQGLLYKNGVLIGTYTGGTAGTISNSNTLLLGMQDTIQGQMTGNIKDVRIYNSALAQSDITKLCNGQESTAVPVARWRLNDGSGTNANDEIGTNDGTLTNGPTWSSQVPPWFVA